MSDTEVQEESKAPVRFNPQTGFEFTDLDGMFRAARMYLQSGFAPSAFKTPQQLVICWARGAELGLRPLQAIDGMSVINNRIGIMGDLALAMVRQTGELAKYEKEWTGEGDSLMCCVTLQRKGGDEHEYSFSVREAKQAGIYSRNPIWPAYPKRMTYYRALGFGLRDEFSDVLKGLYTVEELQDLEHMHAEEPQLPPVKFVDADQPAAGSLVGGPVLSSPPYPGDQMGQDQMGRGGVAAGGGGYQPVHSGGGGGRSTPLETQLRQQYPQEAHEAEKKSQQGGSQSTVDASQSPTQAQSPSPSDSATNHQGMPDDIDYGPSAEQRQEPAQQPWWFTHEIKGIRSFLGRNVGGLSVAEMQLIESKWVPEAHKQIARATQEQLDDLKALEERIAHDKTAKPWAGV